MKLTIDKELGRLYCSQLPLNTAWVSLVEWPIGRPDQKHYTHEFPTVSRPARGGYRYGGRAVLVGGAAGPWATEVQWDPAPKPTPPAAPTKFIGLCGNVADDASLDDAQAQRINAFRVCCGLNGMTTADISAVTAHNRLAARGIKMLPLVNDYSLAWNDPRWEQIVQAVLPFADLGWIEIANEPYGAWFWGDRSTDLQGYIDLVVRCRKIANAAGVKVLAGVLHSTAAALAPHTDGFAVHPYPNPVQPADPDWDYSSAAAIHKDFPDIPIVMTEVGMKIDRGLTTQANFAQKVRTDVLVRNNPWLLGAFWYEQRDYWPFNPKGDNGWGLIDENAQPRPAHAEWVGA